MQALEHFRLLRRRWYYLVIGCVVGLAAGYATAPGAGNRPVRYAATTTLLQDVANPGVVDLDQVALLVTTGGVPDDAAARLGDETERAEAVGAVEAIVDPDTSSLSIRATANTARRAEALAAAFTDALLSSLAADSQAEYNTEVEQANLRVQTLTTEADQAAALAASLSPDDPRAAAATTEVDAANDRLRDAIATQQQLAADGPRTPPLELVERGVGREVAQEGVRAPDDKVERAVLLGMFGLLLGAGGATAVDRLDTRIRGQREAEEAFGVPVIAEIPPLPGGRKTKADLLAVSQPSSPVVEAYRSLRTVVLYTAATAGVGGGNGGGHNSARKLGAAQHAEHDSQVVLITSPGAGEGKTTTAAHLAALLAEVGKTVLIVSADFRRPRIHEYFGVERSPGLSDILTGSTSTTVADINVETQVPGVKLMASGSPVNNPAPFLRETAQLVAAARKLFDYVIVDTAPLLVANDATELAGVADMVIVLARADRTTRDSAQRGAEMLERVDAPILGAVVIAANDTPTAYRYYRYRYYGEDDGQKKRRPSAAPTSVVAPMSTVS